MLIVFNKASKSDSQRILNLKAEQTQQNVIRGFFFKKSICDLDGRVQKQLSENK